MNRTHRLSILLSLVVVGLLLVAGCSKPAKSSSSSTGASGASSATVTIRQFAFDPADLTVKPGTEVTFKNDDSVAHTVTGAGLDSGSIAPGASWSTKFDTAGTFDYGCSIHPNMRGSVKVAP